MKILYIQNKIIYLSIFFLILLLIATIVLFNITNPNTDLSENIVYIDEKEDFIEENEMLTDENNNNNFLLEKYNEKKLLALTFDDGPSKYTNSLIDELNKRKVNVTFFLLGENVKKYQDTVKFAVDSGNEIGIHSYKHNFFTKISDSQINEQILLTKYSILNIVDVDLKLIRVPYGILDDRVENILKENNLKNILWTVDSKDWKFKNVDKTYNYVLKYIKGNDIILMHDILTTSIKSALKLVDKLQSDGYVFVTVSKFLEIQELAKENLALQITF